MLLTIIEIAAGILFASAIREWLTDYRLRKAERRGHKIANRESAAVLTQAFLRYARDAAIGALFITALLLLAA